MANELILIVDADAKSRGVLDVSLKKAGYRVQTFERGRDALAWVQGGGEPPVLLVCEATSAAGMAGLALLEQVREALSREDLPCMLLTDGPPSAELKRRAGDVGVEDFLSRPVYSKELGPRVELLLQRRAKEALALVDGAEVQGALGELGLLDLLQALEERRRSAVIELTQGARRGSLTCVSGQVVEASVGRLRGGAAVQRLLQWTQGSYRVRPAEGSRARASGPDLLVEGLRERERWEAAAAGQDLARIFEVHYQKLADHLRDMPEELHAVLRLFDGYRTLDDVVDDSPLAPAESLHAIQRLREQGLIRDITPAAERPVAGELVIPKETESEWLSMEAAETVGGRNNRRADAKESEAETVRRRREERKRRKSQQLHAERAEPVARLGSSADAPSSRRIQARAGAVDAQAEQMRRELEESLARRAPLAAAAPSTDLRAKLEAAEQEAARLEAERQKLREALEREEQAVKLEAERLRLEAERLEAERALALVRAREEREAREREVLAREEQTRRAQAERAERERLELERERVEAERLRVEMERKVRAEAEARLFVEQEKLAAARKALEEAEAKLREEQAREAEAKRAPLVVAAPALDLGKAEPPKAEPPKAEPPKAEPPKEEVKAAAVVVPPLEAPSASAEGSGAGLTKTLKVAPVEPEPKAGKAAEPDEDGFFSSHTHEDHAADPDPAVSSSKLTVGVIALLFALGIGGVIYYSQTQDDAKPKPPVFGLPKPDAGPAAPAPSKDAGAPDAMAAKDAEPAKDAAPDAAVAVAPEQVVDARGKAREVMFELAFSRMFHPDTGLPLVADKNAPPEDGAKPLEDGAKPPVDGAKPPVDSAKSDGVKGGEKVAPVVDKGPKEVKEPPISTAPDPVKFDDKNAKQEFDRRFKAGAALAKSGKCDKAIPELQAADSVQGGSSQVNSLLGRCFMSTGGFAKAVTYLEKAVRLNGTNADAVRMLGDAYQATGQRGKAIDAYRKYLELRPTGAVSDELRRILAQYH